MSNFEERILIEIATDRGIFPNNNGTTIYLEYGNALRVEGNNIF